MEDTAVVEQVRQNIGQMVDDLWNLREQKRELEKKASDVEKKYQTLEGELMARMQSEATPVAGGSKGRVTMSERVVPSVKDWDAFYSFIHRHKYYHLLERRPAVLGCRELFETKGMIPGVEPFRKSSLRLVTNGESE